MKRYPEYKESHVDWIGEIPKHWKYSRLKFHLTENSGGVWGKDDEFGNGTYVLRSTEITIAGNWDLQRLIKRKLSKEETEKFLLKKYDLVITKSSGSQDHIGKTGLVDEKIESMFVCYSNFVQRICPKNHINSKFLHYFMNCPLAREQYKYQSETTTGLANLSTKSIDELLIPLPPIHEQTQIAKFLDRKTKQIDELIRIKERQIELLQEQRTALINQVVTNGLDPNVEMKPSGVEWIGEIPGHWEVRRNRRVFSERDDRSATGKEELLTVSHITGVSPRAEKTNVGMFLAETLEGYKHCSVGNLVINTMWAWMGALGISSFDGVVSPSYNVYQLKSSEYVPKYYDYLYRTPNHIKEIIRWSKGIWHSRWRLYPDAFFSMFTITPPFSEQAKIVDFLNCKTKQIDELISDEQRKIELLREYRQSLISEAVTGKIDVRSEM